MVSEDAKHDKKHPLEYIAVFFALVAAIGACVAAGFAGYQGWVARDTEKHYLRAYVLVDAANLGIDANKMPKVAIDVKNFGLTPAYEFRHWSCALARPIWSKDEDFPDISKGVVADVSIVAPQHPKGKVYNAWCGIGTEISDSEREQIRAGSKALFVIGKITYRDAFHEPHITRYRIYWNDKNPTVNFDAASGNCADEGCEEN
jgi:hypothetical protein